MHYFYKLPCPLHPQQSSPWGKLKDVFCLRLLLWYRRAPQTSIKTERMIDTSNGSRSRGCRGLAVT